MIVAAIGLDSCHARGVSGHMPDLRFRLVDDRNRTVTQADYRGQPLVLYFGYTGCGAQCPLTLRRLEALSTRTKFQVLFVSVDPLDTPERLHAYLRLFPGLNVSGLSGREANVRALARRYRAAYELPVHGTALYIFDGKGHIRFLLTENDPDHRLLFALHEASHD